MRPGIPPTGRQQSAVEQGKRPPESAKRSFRVGFGDPRHLPILPSRRAGQGPPRQAPSGPAARDAPGPFDRKPARRPPLVALLVLLLSSPALAQQPPRSLIQEIAANGSLFQKELARYTYRQHFTFYELDRTGAAAGHYQEVRDILFTAAGERSEEFVGRPVMNLHRMRLTEEDFRDLREVQPFVLTEDTLWSYEVIYKGDETIDGEPCYVFRVRPRQILEGQRFLDGLLWVSRRHRQVMRASGQPVPQIYAEKGDNLFAHFTTLYEPVDGKFWFPVKTEAADTLPFRDGLQHVRYHIGFENYKRFSAESTIEFEQAGP